MYKTITEKKLSKEKILPGIILSLAISFILFLYAPIELYCTNLDEFWFDFGKLLLLILGMFISGLLLMVSIYAVLLLIHPVLYRIGLAGGLLLLVCTYVQGNFLIANLPPLDGTNINWNDYLSLRRESLILWGVTGAIIVFLFIVLKTGCWRKLLF